MSDRAIYASLIAIIASGTAVVTMTFGLFNSVLKDLLPQVDGAQQAVNFFSFGTLVVLLALTLIVRQHIQAVAQIVWAVAGIVCLVAAVFVFFSFRNVVNTYTFAYSPDGSEQRTQIVIRGDYHEQGRRILGTRTPQAAIAASGGLPIVLKYNLLWTVESRNQVSDLLVRYYAVLTFLMTTALYVVAIAVWRSVSGKPVRAATRSKPRKRLRPR